MRNFIDKIILRNRYTLLLSVLAAYIIVLVVEGALTGREAKMVNFENPFFDLNVSNMEEFMNNRK